jgi:hypothetical protein
MSLQALPPSLARWATTADTIISPSGNDTSSQNAVLAPVKTVAASFAGRPPPPRTCFEVHGVFYASSVRPTKRRSMPMAESRFRSTSVEGSPNPRLSDGDVEDSGGEKVGPAGQLV